MAQSTTAEDITRLEAELAALRTKIGNQESLRAVEEGGGNARFSTEFTPIDSLYRREATLQTRLDTLYRGVA